MQPNPIISIHAPCKVDRSQFTKLSQGSFCHSCEKQVVDYTGMSDRELLQALRQNPKGCGSFRTDQLERPLLKDELIKRGYSLAAIAMLLALQVCSLGLFAQDTTYKTDITLKTNLLTPINSNAIVMNPIIESLQIIDDKGYPLSQATVAILNASNEIIGGEVTDSAGYVILKLEPGATRIRISYIGYQHVEMLTKEIGDELIELYPLSSNLATATITAEEMDPMSVVEGMFGGSIAKVAESLPDETPALSKPKLNIYPNPSAGQSTLKSDLLTDGRLINIYAATGQLVQSTPVHLHSADQIQLDLPTRFESGTYIIELVLASGFTEATKWVVVR